MNCPRCAQIGRERIGAYTNFDDTERWCIDHGPYYNYPAVDMALADQERGKKAPRVRGHLKLTEREAAWLR